MLLAAEASGLDPGDDWARWLAKAGFADAHIVDLLAPAGTTLTVARKPAS